MQLKYLRMAYTSLLLLLLVLGATAQDGKDAKMAGVNKVIEMLEELQKKVLAEGEKEADTYNKFACFCKDTSAEKTESIKKGEDAKDELAATIASLASDRDDLDAEIVELQEDIAAADKRMDDATAEHKKAKAKYDANVADLAGAESGIHEAIKEEKGGMGASFVQSQSMAKTVRKAILMADALGLVEDDAKQALSGFLQEPEVPIQDFSPHSEGAVKTLETLEGTIHQTNVDTHEAETKRVHKYDMFMQDKTDLVKRKKADLVEAQTTRSAKIAEIAANNQELTSSHAQVLDDQNYLKELTQICSDHAKTWDQRIQIRQDELSALTAATEVIKGKVAEKTSSATIRFAQQSVSVVLADHVAKTPEAMEAIEASAEAADDEPDSFLQKKMAQPRKLMSLLAKKHDPESENVGRQMVVDLLEASGRKLKSTLLTELASTIAADHFAKIKKLIQELIERLLQEAANEANQKGWCDKSIADAEQRRNYAAEKSATINGEMAELEASRDKLTGELAVLAKELADLKAAQSEADKTRADEKAENAETVAEAKAGLEATEEAIGILDKFYKTAANKAKEDPLAFVQGPADDMPDAGFKAGETYGGAQGTAGGILGLLDVIKSDFIRTIAETEKSEAENADDHFKFTTETEVSLAEKTMAEEQSTKYKDDAVAKLESADSDLTSQSELLVTAIKELIELQPACVDTGMSYQERVARREQEIESLKKALCVLTAYAEYGPDGMGDQC